MIDKIIKEDKELRICDTCKHSGSSQYSGLLTCNKWIEFEGAPEIFFVHYNDKCKYWEENTNI